MAAVPSRTAWRNSSPRKKWTAAPATGGRPMIGTSRSRASTRLPSRSPSASRSPPTMSRPLRSAIPPPAARNVLVRFGVTDVQSGAVTWIDLGSDTDIYLARVNWLPDGKTLAIQRESRDQRKLDLLFADIDTGESRVVLTETSASWIELNDELSFLEQIQGVHLGVEPRRLQALVSVRLRRSSACGGSPPVLGTSMIFAHAPSRASMKRAAGSISRPPRKVRRSASSIAPRWIPKIRTRSSASPETMACTASPCRRTPAFTSITSPAAPSRRKSACTPRTAG